MCRLLLLLLLLIPGFVQANDLFTQWTSYNERNRALLYYSFQRLTGTLEKEQFDDESVAKKVRLDEVHGLPQQAHDLAAQYRHLDQRHANTPRLVFFHGPSGTGKSFSASIIADELGFHKKRIIGAAFNDKHIGVGADKIRELFKELRASNKPTLLIVDQIEMLLGRKPEGEHPEYLNTAGTFMEQLVDPLNRNIFVIGTIRDLSLISRSFLENGELESANIKFELPNAEARAAIIRSYLEKQQVNVDDAILQLLITRSHCLSAKDVCSAIDHMPRANFEHHRLIQQLNELRQRRNEDLERVFREQERENSIKFQAPLCTLDDFAGEVPERARATLDRFMQQGNQDGRAHEVSPGMLLYGPGGTGKSFLAEAFAGSAFAKFVCVSASMVNGALIGSGAERISSIFRQVKTYLEQNPEERIVIFFDEFDSLARRGGHHQGDNTINQLKVELSELARTPFGRSVIVIGATNHEDELDKNLMRAGRFGAQIRLDLPSLEMRRAILTYYLRQQQHNIQNLDQLIEHLAQRAEGFNIAELKAIVTEKAHEARGRAVRLEQTHVEQGFNDVHAQYRERLKQMIPQLINPDPSLNLYEAFGVYPNGENQQVGRAAPVIPGQITDYLNRLRQADRLWAHAIFYGDSDEKGHIARCVAQEVGAEMVFIDARHITRPEQVEKIFSALRSINRPSVLIIDWIEKLIQNDQHNFDPLRAQAAQFILAETHNTKNKFITVIGICNSLSAKFELGQQGKFVKQVEITFPNDQARQSILKHETTGFNLREDQIMMLVKATKNFNCRAMRDMIHEVRDGLMREPRLDVFRHCSTVVSDWCRERDDREINKLRDNGITIMAPEAKIFVGDIASDIPRLCREFGTGIRDLGNKRKKGILLYGPPGTGKTTIAEIFAHQAGAKFIMCHGGAFADKWAGEGPRKINEFFERIKTFVNVTGQKVVIFFDEFEGLGGKRNNDSHKEETRMNDALLSQFNSLRKEYCNLIFYIAATNRREDLDEAVHARFDAHIMMDVPDLYNRRMILEHYLAQTKHTIFDSAVEEKHRAETLDQVLKDTRGFACRDLENLVVTAEDIAIDRSYAVLAGTPVSQTYLEQVKTGLKVTLQDLQNAVLIIRKLVDYRIKWGKSSQEREAIKNREFQLDLLEQQQYQQRKDRMMNLRSAATSAASSSNPAAWVFGAFNVIETMDEDVATDREQKEFIKKQRERLREEEKKQ